MQILMNFSLANNGHLISCAESDLLKYFAKSNDTPSTNVTVKVFDGSVVVYFLQPNRSVSTVGEYVQRQLVPFA